MERTDGEMIQPETLIREIQKGLVQWYGFAPAAGAVRDILTSEKKPHILYIGRPEDPIAELLTDRLFRVTCAPCGQTAQESWQQNRTAGFDYIISIETLEQQPAPENFLASWRGTGHSCFMIRSSVRKIIRPMP